MLQALETYPCTLGKMHIEYRLGKSNFDFFLLKRVFWEFHPINLKLGKDIYKYGKEVDILWTNRLRAYPIDSF